MPTLPLADFLSPTAAAHGASGLTPVIQQMQGSMILQIAGQVRALIAQGQAVCNLTVGDFDPKQFPIPATLKAATLAAYEGGQTNYPPSEGIPELRKAICAWYAEALGLQLSPEWVIIASGARPVMYATYTMFLRPGDTLVYCVPSWNNGYYGQLTQAREIAIQTRAEDNFFPTVAQLAPALEQATLFTLNSPLNPTGTVISAEALTAIARLIVEINGRRAAAGERPLMWMWDQVYWQLTYGESRHVHPIQVVPEVTPYVITIDAISKTFAATGERVGWAVLPPLLAERMKSFLGHVGAWAPKPEQAATVSLLADTEGTSAFLNGFRHQLEARLRALSAGLAHLGIEHTRPQGAMYLSARFALAGRTWGEQVLSTNEDVRRFLLEAAGLAIVPFQAFDLPGETGWFRLSVGAIRPDEIDAMLTRLGSALQTLR